MKGYVQLRRGIAYHLRGMTGSELKVYVWLLIEADFAGEHVGTLTFSIRDTAKFLGMSTRQVQESLKRLSEPHENKATYIKYEPGSNQYSQSKVAIIKYQNGVSHKNTPSNTARDTAVDTPMDTANGHKDLKTLDLKNLENVKQLPWPACYYESDKEQIATLATGNGWSSEQICQCAQALRDRCPNDCSHIHAPCSKQFALDKIHKFNSPTAALRAIRSDDR